VAQFAVYRNRNARTKAAFPLLLDVQSDLLEPLQTRVVVPLSRAAGSGSMAVSHLMPELTFEHERYVLMTPQLAGVARADLGSQAGSLVEQRAVILAAVNFLAMGF
jgi:toxin CcdB